LSTVSKKIFPNLNAYRFLAALLVVFHHVEQIRYNAHQVNLKQYSLFNNGAFAVQFFFVLSGFLITYLLFSELENTKSISLSTFYLKRVLRIWPLYYVLVFLGFVMLPLFMAKQTSFSNKFPYLNTEGVLLYLCILPNVANAIWSKHFLISLWSIGVEEQFYLFWAPVIKWLRDKVVFVCISLIVFRLFYDSYLKSHFLPTNFTHSIITSLRFDCMAIGALVAYWYQIGISPIWQKLVYSIFFEFILAVFLVFFLIFRFYLKEYGIILDSSLCLQMISVAFAFLILNGATNSSTIFKISSNWINYLGSISYGIYLYHMIFVFLVVEIMKKLSALNGMPLLASIFAYVIVMCTTVLVSAFSYKYIESPIIRLKKNTK
jgi:peptidoglycan/LPS O-acetylase OafA/YrhL